MEPGIKSEPCETLYSGQESDNGARLQYSQHLSSQISLKRPNDEMADSADQRRTRYQHQKNTTYYPAVDFPNVPHQFYKQDNTMPEPNQSTIAADGRPLKKYKRIEENVLFNPPFFKLVEKFLSPSQKEAIGARCYSCGKIVKGNRGISSNFIKHMKRAHPEINKIYEDFKAHKIKPGHLPNLVHALEAQMLNRNYATAAENGASGSDSNAAYSNDDTNQFSEVNNTLENNTMCYSSDENEDSLNTTNEKSCNESQVVNNFETRPIELSTNTLEIFGNLIDEKLKHFVKQKEYNQLHEKVDDLIKGNPTNNASSEVALTELKSEMDNLKKECAVLRLSVQQSQASKRQLQYELQTVDKLLHQRKLIIRNIQVCDSEQPLKSVKKLFSEKLDLPDIKIINCSIIPTLKTSNESNKECLSLELDCPQACKAIFRQAHKLKNTGIFIESEISPFQRKRKNKLMVLRKELLRRKPDLKVLVRDITLVVNGKNFYWDDVEGLCHDGKHEAIELNGVEYLKMLSGLDLSEFINILQNYNIQIN